MNWKSKKYSQNTIGILYDSLRVVVSVWVSVGTRMRVWVIVAY